MLMRSRLCACLAIAILGAVTAACGSSTKAGSGTSAGKLAVAQIEQSWVKFFNPSTPPSAAISLLQNGTKFAATIDAQAKSPLAKESSATVSAVKLTGPTTATVTYTLKLAGQPVPGLKNATGTAIKTGSTWQVSDASFCQLLKLEGSAPAACPKG
jgi:hypothetical protein